MLNSSDEQSIHPIEACNPFEFLNILFCQVSANHYDEPIIQRKYDKKIPNTNFEDILNEDLKQWKEENRHEIINFEAPKLCENSPIVIENETKSKKLKKKVIKFIFI